MKIVRNIKTGKTGRLLGPTKKREDGKVLNLVEVNGKRKCKCWQLTENLEIIQDELFESDEELKPVSNETKISPDAKIIVVDSSGEPFKSVPDTERRFFVEPFIKIPRYESGLDFTEIYLNEPEWINEKSIFKPFFPHFPHYFKLLDKSDYIDNYILIDGKCYYCRMKELGEELGADLDELFGSDISEREKDIFHENVFTQILKESQKIQRRFIPIDDLRARVIADREQFDSALFQLAKDQAIQLTKGDPRERRFDDLLPDPAFKNIPYVYLEVLQ